MQIKTSTLVWAATGVLAVGAASGWAAPQLLQASDTTNAGSSAATVVPAGPIPLGTAPNYRAIVAQSEGAVVGIMVSGETKVSQQQQPFNFGGDDDDSPFAQFFRQIPQPKGGVPFHGQGSGFIVSSDGVILTNAHVVDNAKEVTVKLTDHREFRAKVLGSDKTSDIAVLKIEAHDLPVERIGNSDQLHVGDYVLAIGAPFGLEETATAGIVSATGRSLPGDGYVPFIQTDAAVNPGNSGGPLFDATGAVVGINSQIYSNSGGYQGVAFAIPINLAVQVKDQLVKNGKVEHGRLGVEVQTVDQSLANSFKLPAPTGALISKVEPDSAAAQAGLKSGDIILKYNDVTIGDAAQLSTRVNLTPPGEKASLEVWRDGKSLSLSAKVASANDATVADNGSTGEHGRLGLTVRPLTKDERDQSGLPGGLLVQNAEGKAAEAGIQSGDVVLSVNGAPVNSVEQLRSLVQHDQQVALLIERGDNRLYVPVDLS